MGNEPFFREWTIRDLSEFGIGHLTGESCAISLRILYDLTAEGLQHIENAFCIKLADNSQANWNSFVGKMPAVYSIKMSPNQAYHILVCILASYHDVVLEFTPIDNPNYKLNGILMSGNTEGYNYYREQYLQDSSWVLENYNIRTYCKPSQEGQPSTGLDNYHAFSGRTT
jgi:hypothetical protein